MSETAVSIQNQSLSQSSLQTRPDSESQTVDSHKDSYNATSKDNSTYSSLENNFDNPPKPKSVRGRRKKISTEESGSILLAHFSADPNPRHARIAEIARDAGKTIRGASDWFAARRLSLGLGPPPSPPTDVVAEGVVYDAVSEGPEGGDSASDTHPLNVDSLPLDPHFSETHHRHSLFKNPRNRRSVKQKVISYVEPNSDDTCALDNASPGKRPSKPARSGASKSNNRQASESRTSTQTLNLPTPYSTAIVVPSSPMQSTLDSDETVDSSPWPSRASKRSSQSSLETTTPNSSSLFLPSSPEVVDRPARRSTRLSTVSSTSIESTSSSRDSLKSSFNDLRNPLEVAEYFKNFYSNTTPLISKTHSCGAPEQDHKLQRKVFGGGSLVFGFTLGSKDATDNEPQQSTSDVADGKRAPKNPRSQKPTKVSNNLCNSSQNVICAIPLKFPTPAQRAQVLQRLSSRSLAAEMSCSPDMLPLNIFMDATSSQSPVDISWIPDLPTVPAFSAADRLQTIKEETEDDSHGYSEECEESSEEGSEAESLDLDLDLERFAHPPCGRAYDDLDLGLPVFRSPFLSSFMSPPKTLVLALQQQRHHRLQPLVARLGSRRHSDPGISKASQLLRTQTSPRKLAETTAHNIMRNKKKQKLTHQSLENLPNMTLGTKSHLSTSHLGLSTTATPDKPRNFNDFFSTSPSHFDALFRTGHVAPETPGDDLGLFGDFSIGGSNLCLDSLISPGKIDDWLFANTNTHTSGITSQTGIITKPRPLNHHHTSALQNQPRNPNSELGKTNSALTFPTTHVVVDPTFHWPDWFEVDGLTGS